MTNIINLTMHDVVLFNNDNELVTTFKSSGLARCEESESIVGYVDKYPIVKKTFGDITGLPKQQDNTIYIVSRLVVDALAGTRDDVFSVADTVRDESGRIIGFKSFAR